MPSFNSSSISPAAIPRWIVLAGCVAGLGAGLGAGPPPEAAAPPAATAPKDQAVAVGASDLTSLNRLLAVGKTARNVTVPTVDDDGRLTSIATMGSITRIDEDNFLLEKVVLTSFDPGQERGTDEPPPADTTIRLIEARYHAPTRVLISDQRISIQKPTILLTGHSLHYDSAAGQAVIKGPSEAIIKDAPVEATPAEGAGDGKVAGDAEDLDSPDDTATPAPTTPAPDSPTPATPPCQ